MDDLYEREIRAARNHAIFRSINEKLRQVNAALASVSGRVVIACECADTSCVETLEIDSDDYLSVRRNPRRFIVLRGHVYPDVEDVVGEEDAYAVVEKHGAASEVTEATDPTAMTRT